MSAPRVLETPQFDKSVIQGTRTDGYWLETVYVDPNDKYPSLIGYGLTLGEICVFDNPRNSGPVNPSDGEPEWKTYKIATLLNPVAARPAEVAGSGRQDVIITHLYGATFLDTNPDGGFVSWLENPGRNVDGTVAVDWKMRFIGRWPSMHRLKAGKFTQRSLLEVVAMPITHGPHDIETPIPIFLYQRDVWAPHEVEWKRTVIDDKNFTIIHECAIKRFEGNDGLDSLFVASREGINWLYYQNGQWVREHIHEGMPKQPGKDYYGSACVDAGKVGNDSAAYMMTIDPFHGTEVAALIKKKTGPNTHEWVRHVLDVYGNPKQRLNKGDGPGHYIVTADFDGDGDDECLVALFGPSPGKGVFYYKAIDLDKGIFAKWQVAKESAARIAIGHFTGRRAIDFAIIGYNVPLYYEEKDPRINLYAHAFRTSAADASQDVVVSLWAGEPIYYMPHPTNIQNPRVEPLMEIAGFRITLEIYPPNYKAVANGTHAVKMMYGKLYNQVPGSAVVERRALSVAPYEASNARLTAGFIATKDEGCIFVRFAPLSHPLPEYATSDEVPVRNLFNFTYPELQLPEPLKFVRVDTLDWRMDKFFQGQPFFNLSGITFRFMDGVHLSHLQFWTIAKNVSAGIHNHASDWFLEAHLGMSTGTGNGGMWRVKASTVVDPANPNDVPVDGFEPPLPLHPLFEHGPFWDRDENNMPVRREDGSIVYRWHKWQGGNQRNNIDVWAAFEFNPDLVAELK